MVAVIGAAVVLALSGQVAAAAPAGSDRLDVYTATVDAEQLGTIASQGFDVADQRRVGSRVAVDLVATRASARSCAQQGIDATPRRGSRAGRPSGSSPPSRPRTATTCGGPTTSRAASATRCMPSRPTTRRSPSWSSSGTTIQGREILAIKLTQGARGQADGSRPAVLYSATQHAREWIATEVNRRLMNWYVDQWRANDRDVKQLLQEHRALVHARRQPGRLPVHLQHERLWRKNLRDNDGNGQITVGDGVDPNRNFPNHWGYDNEGSSSDPVERDLPRPGTGVRGRDRGDEGPPRPGQVLLPGQLPLQRPVAALPRGLADRHRHRGRPDLLRDVRQPRQSGDRGLPPGLSSDVLYVTNGETTDYAHAGRGTLAWTPELSPAARPAASSSPTTRRWSRRSSSGTCPSRSRWPTPRPTRTTRSRASASRPSRSTWRARTRTRRDPGRNLRFNYSYGDPQPVAVIAKRSLGAVTAKWKVNGGAEQSAPTTSGTAARSTPPPASTTTRFAASSPAPNRVTRSRCGSRAAASAARRSPTEAVSETGNKVLVVAAEDYTGASPAQTPGPTTPTTTSTRSKANGIDADVYDVDARKRTAPDQLGVLSHYDAAIWYPGDDIVTRKAGTAAGNADRLALDEMFEFRAYLNEGGKVLYTGDRAGDQYTGNVGNQLYDPKGEIACNPLPAGIDARRCLLLRGSGDGVNDVLQYWFGGYLPCRATATTRTETPSTCRHRRPVHRSRLGPQRRRERGQPGHTRVLPLRRAGSCRPDEFKQFESWPSARWDKPGGPFAPHTGDQYMYSQITDVSYKRLTRDHRRCRPVAADDVLLDVLRHRGRLGLRLRGGPHRAATTGRRCPTLNGHTTPGTGESCPARAGASCTRSWTTTRRSTRDGTCTPTGTTGAWNAASGNSAGWQQWSVDLDDWQGSRSRSPSPTRATGPPRASASSSTT